MGLSSYFSTTWLRFLVPSEKPPKRPERMADDFRDYTFSTLGALSNAMTPEDLQGILTQAADGYCDSQAVLLKEVQEKEPVIAAHLATRKLAMAGKPWTVSSEADPDRAAEIEKMLRLAGLTEAMMHLADSIMTGYSGAVIDWQDGGARVAGFVPVAPEAFEFDYGGNAAFKDKMGKLTPLSAYHAAQFLTLFNQAKPGIPCRNGLGRGLLWLYLFKHSGLAGFARYIERYGVPFLVATLPPSQWADRNAVLTLMKRLGRDGVSVKKEGATLELLQGANGSATDAQERFLRYCDEVFAIAILGQLATSGDAGGLSKGQAQENVRMDLLAADCQAMASAVNRQVIEPLCQMGYGQPDAGDIVFSIEYEPTEDLDAKAARWKLLTEVAGRPMESDVVEEEFGVTFATAPAVPGVGEGPQAVGAPAGEGVIADTALNGAQIASMVTTMQAAAAGELPVGAVLPIFTAAFPMVPAATLAAIAGSLNGFVPPAKPLSGAVSANGTGVEPEPPAPPAGGEPVEEEDGEEEDEQAMYDGQPRAPAGSPIGGQWVSTGSVSWVTGTGKKATVTATLRAKALGNLPDDRRTHIDIRADVEGMGEVGREINELQKPSDPKNIAAGVTAKVGKLGMKKEHHDLVEAELGKIREHPEWKARVEADRAEGAAMAESERRRSDPAWKAGPRPIVSAEEQAAIREHDRWTRKFYEQERFTDTAPIRALETVVDDALRQVTSDPEAMAAWLGPVQDAIREAFGDLQPGDVEEFKRRLPAFMQTLPRLLPTMNSAGFEEALAGAMLAAAVNGYTQGPQPQTQGRLP